MSFYITFEQIKLFTGLSNYRLHDCLKIPADVQDRLFRKLRLCVPIGVQSRPASGIAGCRVRLHLTAAMSSVNVQWFRLKG